MDEFRTASHGRFVEQLKNMLLTAYPIHFDRESVEPFVDKVLEKCRGYEIRRKEDIEDVAVRMVRDGPEFETLESNRHVYDVLMDPCIPTAEKMSRVYMREIAEGISAGEEP